jgi:hypothetical protein
MTTRTIKNARVLILSILTTILVIAIWSPSTGFSSIVDGIQSSLDIPVDDSSNTISSNKNNKVVVLTFDDGWKNQ